MKKLKLEKKTVANLSGSQMGAAIGGASGDQCLQSQNCNTNNCATKECTLFTKECEGSRFFICQSIDGTVCPTSGDVECFTIGCTDKPTVAVSYDCTTICH